MRLKRCLILHVLFLLAFIGISSQGIDTCDDHTLADIAIDINVDSSSGFLIGSIKTVVSTQEMRLSLGIRM